MRVTAGEDLASLNTALRRGDRLEIDVIVAALLRRSPPLAAQWKLIAQVSQRNGALTLARKAMRLYVRQSGSGAAERFEEAALLAAIGDLKEAEKTLAALPPDFPDPAIRAHFAGTLALNQGDLPAARTHFAAALAARPTSGATWLSLADASRNMPAGDWAPLVIAAGDRMKQASGADRAGYFYALGAAQDALENHASAFAAFANGAHVVAAGRPHDIEADEAAAAQAMETRSLNPRVTIDTSRPIFVFGPPRSGTTLVEQILASHSAVTDGGEVQLFDLVARRIGGLSGAALDRGIDRYGADALATDYLTLLQERFGGEGRIVDKSLTTTRFLGMVSTILPNAPLVWVDRDPLDTAWSCFRTLFANGINWSFDQISLARHLLAEQRLLAFWKEQLGARLLVLSYRDLVTDPAHQITRLLQHCGLAVEPAVFEPQRTRRAITTASVTQVRSPINTRALGAAMPYRRYLTPFVDAYIKGGGRIELDTPI